MSSLPSISHRLFAAAVSPPQKKEPGKPPRQGQAADPGGHDGPPGPRAPLRDQTGPEPGMGMQRWLGRPAKSEI